MTAILDHGRLAAIALASRVTQKAMLARFLRLNAADAVLLRDAAGLGDFRRVGFFAHRMAGSGLVVGAPRLASASSALSAACATGDAATVQAALAALETEIAGVQSELDALGGDPGATGRSA